MENLGTGTRIKHPVYGHGIVCSISLSSYSISFFEGGLREIPRSDEIELIEVVETPNNMISFDEVEDMLLRLFDKYGGLTEVVEIAEKWKGGLLVLEPKDQDLQVKEIPIDTFFHKIVMLRDRLRVLEQNINSHPKLDDSDKVELQQYVTRMYGSLTTFNILFRHKEHHFVGEGKKKA